MRQERQERAAIRATPAPRISGESYRRTYMVEKQKGIVCISQQSGTIVLNNQLTSPIVNITII